MPQKAWQHQQWQEYRFINTFPDCHLSKAQLFLLNLENK